MQDNVVDQKIQDYFVLLAIQDTKFLQAARQTVKITYFGSSVTQDLIKICYEFFDQFQQAPGHHFKDEFIRFISNKSNEDIELYMIYFERLQQMETPNQNYVISRVNQFVQAREIERGAIELAKLAKVGDFEKAKSLMQKILRSGIVKEEVGVKYFDRKIPSYLKPHSSNEKLMGFGVPYIDQRFPRGLCRTDFLCLLGGFKGMKSWGCNYIGQLGLISGLKVLHITHELSLEDTEMRYDMGFGGAVGRLDSQVAQVELEEYGDDGQTVNKRTENRPTVADMDYVMKTQKKIQRFGGQLIIQKYPMGMCTMDEIRRYLDYLESFEGFVPDILINDYIEKMRVPSGDKRNDAINDMYIQMKGLLDERKMLGVTVSQTTRDALRSQRLGQKDFAEDIRKLGNVDQVVAISQTDEMANHNRMLMYVLANRHGAMDFGSMFSYNLSIGQFCIDSWPYKPVVKRDKK